jgi:hypothetical protein
VAYDLLVIDLSFHRVQSQNNFVVSKQFWCYIFSVKFTLIATNNCARKAITLIVEVAYAGGEHMILAVLTVSLVLSA